MTFWKRMTDNWQDSVNLLLGLWLIISPWILGFAMLEAAMWNAVAFGILMVLVAIAALVDFHEWEEWADMAIGVWLILSPWVLGFDAIVAGTEGGMFAATWNMVVVGVLTFALAAWSLRHHQHHATA